jgi:polysaccharide deacetylase family protein (PEP-CTERM system associated)
MQNKIMTVDVEDYFQVAAFKDNIPVDKWDNYEYRAGERTRELLDVFSRHGVKATFFVLGWVAKKDPELIRRIVSEGHELASHGYWHQKAFEITRAEFKKDITIAKDVLEDISGERVIGYRAPSFSIDKRNEWAFDELASAGYLYSSSTYAVAHDHYGTPDWPTEPYKLDNGLLELPQATIDIAGRRIPVGGGGYFRLLPLSLSKLFINQYEKQHNAPYIFYFHPWEIDHEQPRINDASMKSRFRHYVNLKRMKSKISAISEAYNWTTFRDAYPGLEGE